MINSRILTVLLLFSRHSPAEPLFSEVPGVPDVGDILEDSVGNLGRDFNSLYTGWVNSSFVYPYYLKVKI